MVLLFVDNSDRCLIPVPSKPHRPAAQSQNKDHIKIYTETVRKSATHSQQTASQLSSHTITHAFLPESKIRHVLNPQLNHLFTC
jgi:hypothetical protein